MTSSACAGDQVIIAQQHLSGARRKSYTTGGQTPAVERPGSAKALSYERSVPSIQTPVGQALGKNKRPRRARPSVRSWIDRSARVALLELVDTARGVDDLVLARVERVRSRGN